MPPQNTVNVTILDKEYLVACPPESRDQLRAAARDLDQRMREVRSAGKVHGTERIAVMTALNLAYEVLQNREKEELVRRTVEAVSDRIDEHLKPHAASATIRGGTAAETLITG